MPGTPADFSFDLYPGLDADLEAAYERNVATGLITAEEAATSGLAAVVQNALAKNPNGLNALVSQEAQAWSVDAIIQAGNAWYNLRDELGGVTVPTSYQELKNTHKDFETTVNRLYTAREALLASGEVNPDGVNVGETMRLVMLPWRAFHTALTTDNTVNQILRVRQKQGIQVDEYVNEDLRKAIRDGTPLYRDPDNPGRYISTSAYLEKKLASDGDWGMMLIQTSNKAGVQSLLGQSPNQLTEQGQKDLTINGQVVSNLGFYEWIATTFQDDPRLLSSSDYSWMLANRLDVNGGPRVPYGDWGVDHVRSSLFGAGFQFGDVRPRLAVM